MICSGLAIFGRRGSLGVLSYNFGLFVAGISKYGRNTAIPRGLETKAKENRETEFRQNTKRLKSAESPHRTLVDFTRTHSR